MKKLNANEPKDIVIIGDYTPVQIYQHYIIREVREIGCKGKWSKGAPNILSYSIDIAEIRKLRDAKNWGEIGRILYGYVDRLFKVGNIGSLVIANYSLELAADYMIEAANNKTIGHEINRALVRSIDTTADEIKKSDVKQAVLLGNPFEEYRQRLSELSGAEIILPNQDIMQYIHGVIANNSVEFYKYDICDRYASLIHNDDVECIINGAPQLVEISANSPESKDDRHASGKLTHLRVPPVGGNAKDFESYKSAWLFNTPIIHTNAIMNEYMKQYQ